MDHVSTTRGRIHAWESVDIGGGAAGAEGCRALGDETLLRAEEDAALENQSVIC
jgi:hypothetical protein